MIDAYVDYIDGVRFEAATRGHHVLSDQPAENGGANTGMTPPELMVSAIGACAGYYAAEYLRARLLPSIGLRIHVEAEKDSKPARLSAFRIHVEAPNVDQRHHDGLLRAVKHCLIHNTLLQPPSIDVLVETGSQAQVA